MDFVNEQMLEELTNIFASFEQFAFTLKSTGRFSDIGVLYLTVKPSEPFQALGQAIQSKYLELEPFISEPILHVSLARAKDIDRVEKELYEEYGNQLPIHAVGKEFVFMKNLRTLGTKEQVSHYQISVK